MKERKRIVVMTVLPPRKRERAADRKLFHHVIARAKIIGPFNSSKEFAAWRKKTKHSTFYILPVQIPKLPRGTHKQRKMARKQRKMARDFIEYLRPKTIIARIG